MITASNRFLSASFYTSLRAVAAKSETGASCEETTSSGETIDAEKQGPWCAGSCLKCRLHDFRVHDPTRSTSIPRRTKDEWKSRGIPPEGDPGDTSQHSTSKESNEQSFPWTYSCGVSSLFPSYETWPGHFLGTKGEANLASLVAHIRHWPQRIVAPALPSKEGKIMRCWWKSFGLSVSIFVVAGYVLKAETVHVNETKPFYIHVHIPKTGGTAFRKQVPIALGLVDCNALFGMRGCCEKDKYLHFQQVVKADCALSCDFFSYEKDLDTLRNLFAHCTERETRFITMVRDPLLWRISMINHDIRTHRVKSVTEKLADPSRHGYNLMRSTLAFLGKNPIQDIFNDFFFIGIQDMYTKSVCLLQARAQEKASKSLPSCSAVAARLRNKMTSAIEQKSKFTTEDLKTIKSFVSENETLLYAYALVRLKQETRIQVLRLRQLLSR